MPRHRLGIDPVDIRHRKLIQPEQIPYVSRSHTDGHPVVFDSGDYPLLLDRSCERFDYEAALRWRSEPKEAGRARGVGISYFTEKAGIGSFEYARAEVTATGDIAVHTGIASVGQGVETILAQICAERLGVEYDRVGVFHGDTSTTPDGLGAFGSRATMLAGSALADASDRLRARILEHAAAELEAEEGDLDIRRGQIVVMGAPDRTVSIETLRERARPVTALPRGLEPGLSEEAWFHCPDMSFPYRVHLAAVEVDLETGQVEIERYSVGYDIGRTVNSMLVDTPIVGGAAQGVGDALLEELVYDGDGNLVPGSFMDYLLPTAMGVPEVDVLVTEDAPTPLNPLRVKRAGEGRTAAVGATIANAVSDALGTEVTRLLLTPAVVSELARMRKEHA